MDQKKGPKKFTFGFPTRKSVNITTNKNEETSTNNLSKRKPELESTKNPKRVHTIEADDEDEFLASAGIGNNNNINMNIKNKKKLFQNKKHVAYLFIVYMYIYLTIIFN